MHQPSDISLAPSSSTMNPLYQKPVQSQHDPYARIPSRRAIACVTCAKAKTKCDKALPSCARCVAKGIKCDPRSTRRTSDNNYRASVKKTFVSSRRYHSSASVPASGLQPSPRSIPSTDRSRAMRVASHIDFRTAVKMSQQSSAVSGAPTLTPLSTYSSHIIDEHMSYSSSPEQNMGGFLSAMEINNFACSGRLTPQTPESIIFNEPLSMGEHLEQLIASQQWSDEEVPLYGFGFNPDMAAILPVDSWVASEPDDPLLLTRVSWPESDFSMSPPHTTNDLMLHTRGVPSLSTSECSMEDFVPSSIAQAGWSLYQPSSTHMHMASIVAPTPFANDLKSIPNHAPIWEDFFMPGPAPY